MKSCRPDQPGRAVLTMVLSLFAGCSRPDDPPPPMLLFEGLPVSGSLEDALRAGFTSCLEVGTREMRCRRTGVMFKGLGPFSAAVSLSGKKGASGFDHLTLWHDQDQNALLAVVSGLERGGWRSCFTGEDNRGDQGIYTHPTSPVRLSLDLSYAGKRRLRVIPQWNVRERRC